MNKIGLHIHSLQPEVYQALVALRPLGAIIINPTPEWIEDIRAVMGSSFYLAVRKYENGVPFWERPAESWADSIAVMCGDALHYVDGAITYNEPMPQGHDNPDHFPLFDRWQARVIRRLQDAHGLDALAFPFGTGQFTAAEDRVRLDVAFPESCEVCRIISPHDYDWPNIWRSEGWRAMRWLAWLDDIEEAGHGRKEVIISEWGLTQATYGGPDLGWRSGVSQDDYMQQMDEYNAKVCKMPEVRFFAPFNWGGIPFGWESFEHAPPGDFSVVDRIYTITCKEEPEEDKMKVIDRNYQERDEQWALDEYGLRYEKASVPQGQKVFRLIQWSEKTGHSSLITQVLNEDGSPMANIDVAFFWPDAPDPPDPPTEVYPHDWHENFKHGPTNVNGDVGPGMGEGAYKARGECGPHAVWVRHPNIPSDISMCHGMRAGTFHDHMDQVFMLITVGDEPTPPPPPPPNGIVAELRTMGGRLLEIADHLEQADLVAESLKDDVNELADLL